MYRKLMFAVVTIMTVLTSLTVFSYPHHLTICAASKIDVSMNISPTYIVTEVNDEGLIGPITVSNTGPVPLKIRGFISEGGHDINGIPIISDSSNNTQTDKAFLTPEPAEFKLMPGESESVKVIARINGAAPGGIYPIIFFRGQPLDEKTEREFHTSSQIGVITLITVISDQNQGDISEQANITSVAIFQDPQSKSVKISATCENRGNIHANLSGTATIKSHLGQVISDTQLDPAICLPGYKRNITGYINAPVLKEGIYLAEISVNTEKRILPSIPVVFQVADNGKIDTVQMDFAYP
ncbi:MAG: hypothetical protein GX969_02480 [Firmicutes bacterium]|jgi:hypothetical protein|nr:hypothetical protein [Bacillota bacterium]